MDRRCQPDRPGADPGDDHRPRQVAGHLWYARTFYGRAYISIDWCVTCGERDPMTGIEGWHLSTHFLDRALDMALDPGEIRDGLLRPDVIRPHPTEPDQVIHISRRIAIVACNSRAITVMWIEQWRAGDTERRKTAAEDEEFFRDSRKS